MKSDEVQKLQTLGAEQVDGVKFDDKVGDSAKTEMIRSEGKVNATAASFTILKRIAINYLRVID